MSFLTDILKKPSFNCPTMSDFVISDEIYRPAALKERDPLTAVHIGNKLRIAKQIVDRYIEGSSVTVPMILERQLDIRLCSLVAYQFARLFFGPEGPDFHSEHPKGAEMFNLTLSQAANKLLYDSGVNSSYLLPVKYRGYGNPLNASMFRGHQFQINMSAFAERRPIIGYSNTGDSEVMAVKGLKHLEDRGEWHLFKVMPEYSDDMTAIFLSNHERPERTRIEVAHFEEETKKMKSIYRQILH